MSESQELRKNLWKLLVLYVVFAFSLNSLFAASSVEVFCILTILNVFLIFSPLIFEAGEAWEKMKQRLENARKYHSMQVRIETSESLLESRFLLIRDIEKHRCNPKKYSAGQIVDSRQGVAMIIGINLETDFGFSGDSYLVDGHGLWALYLGEKFPRPFEM